MFPTMGAVKRPAPYEILGRIRRHFVGRVVTLAAATAFNAILSEASDYGIYGLVIIGTLPRRPKRKTPGRGGS